MSDKLLSSMVAGIGILEEEAVCKKCSRKKKLTFLLSFHLHALHLATHSQESSDIHQLPNILQLFKQDVAGSKGMGHVLLADHL